MGTVKNILLVEWLDSASRSGWHQLGEDDRISRCVSVGILVKEDKMQIVISSGHSDYGNIADTYAIPKCSITRIRKLRVK